MTSNRSEDKMSSRLNSRLAVRLAQSSQTSNCSWSQQSVVDAQIDANQGNLAEVHSGKDAVAVQGSGDSGEISFNTQDLNSDVFQVLSSLSAPGSQFISAPCPASSAELPRFTPSLNRVLPSLCMLSCYSSRVYLNCPVRLSNRPSTHAALLSVSLSYRNLPPLTSSLYHTRT